MLLLTPRPDSDTPGNDVLAPRAPPNTFVPDALIGWEPFVVVGDGCVMPVLSGVPVLPLPKTRAAPALGELLAAMVPGVPSKRLKPGDPAPPWLGAEKPVCCALVGLKVAACEATFVGVLLVPAEWWAAAWVDTLFWPTFATCAVPLSAAANVAWFGPYSAMVR